MTRVMHLFFEINMRSGHEHLNQLLAKEAPAGLKPGETAVFINKAWTALKMLTSDKDVLLHLRRPGHKPINPEAIRHLPSCVQGRDLNYPKALAKAISDRYVKDLKRAQEHRAALRRKASDGR